MYRLLLLIVIILSLAATGPQATIWRVYPDGSGNAPTIQAAVDSAVSGDDYVLVKGGLYNEENILVDGKDILIDAFEGVPHLEAPSYRSGTGFILRNVTFSNNLNSFRITGFATGISVEDASPFVNFLTIIDCGEGVRVSGSSSAPYFGYTLVDSCGTGYEILQGTGITIQNHTIVNCNSGVMASAGSVTISRCIVYGCEIGVGCSGASVSLNCNNFYNNTGDYSGCTPGVTDFYSDPMFCFGTQPSPGYYYLHIDSPCWTAANPCSLKIGTFTSIYGCQGQAVEERTWGAIKKMYR